MPGEVCLARRRACSTHARVARVSRLIGNSDSTAKPAAWQVRDVERSFFGNGRVEVIPYVRNATPRSGVSKPALVTGLPAKWRVASVCAAPAAGFPAGSSLLRAARWRLLMPGALCCSGSLDVPPTAYTSLAPSLIAISVPFGRHVFSIYYCGVASHLSRIWKQKSENSSKKWRPSAQSSHSMVQRWHLGQKCVPRPASRIRRIGV